MKKKFYKNQTFWLGVAALVLAGSLSLQSASAYFTTYVTAKGGYQLDFGETTDIEENVSQMTKHIVIQNTGDANGDQDVYVRVKVFNGSIFDLAFSDGEASSMGDQASSVGDGSWSLGEDGYYYYSKILKPQEMTSVLDAKITDLPEDYKDSFNIIVVQECTPVTYNADGSAKEADWSATLDSTKEIGTANQTGEE